MIVSLPGLSSRAASGSASVAWIDFTSAPASSLRPLRPLRLIIRVSLILTLASRGATATAFAVCFAKPQTGPRS